MEELRQSPLGADTSGLVTSIIDGTSGDDILIGTEGADAFFGGPGNDTLIERGGADIYLFEAPTDGQDTIRDTGGIVTIVFHSRIWDIDLHRNGTSLIIGDNLAPRTVAVENFYGTNGAIEYLQTYSGTFNLMTTNTGGSGNDVIIGEPGIMRYDWVDGNTVIGIDIDADMVDDFNILLVGEIRLSHFDFIL